MFEDDLIFTFIILFKFCFKLYDSSDVLYLFKFIVKIFC